MNTITAQQLAPGQRVTITYPVEAYTGTVEGVNKDGTVVWLDEGWPAPLHGAHIVLHDATGV